MTVIITHMCKYYCISVSDVSAANAGRVFGVSEFLQNLHITLHPCHTSISTLALRLQKIMTCNTPPYLYRRDKRRKLVHSFNHKEYRIAPNFQGIKFSRIGDWQIFADLNFADQRFQLPRPFPATAHARFISHTQVIGTCQE